jgi:beta-glucanase (GH16 family)
MHWKALNGSAIHKGADYSLTTGDFSKEFHVFSIVWSEDNIRWMVDDQTFLTNSASDVGSANYPFNAEHFFIFNVAVGGNWPGPPDNTTVFPQRMFVDYVRIFQ